MMGIFQLNAQTTPGRDSRCSPISVTGNIVTATDYSGSGFANINTHTDTFYHNNLTATFGAGEPIGSCSGGSTSNKTNWFSFRAPNCATPEIIISTDDRSITDFDTRLSVFRRTIPGDCIGGYAEIACSDNDALPSSSPLTNNSTVILTPNPTLPGLNEYMPGEALFIDVSGNGAASGNYGLIIDANPYIPIVSSVGAGIATLDWSIGMSPTWGDIKKTYIYWRPVGSSSTYSGTYRILDSTISNLTITGLAPGTDYEYWATYVCSGGGRWYSSKGTFSTTGSSCSGGTAPSIVSVMNGTPCNLPVITFNANSLAYSSYKVIRVDTSTSSVLSSSTYYASPGVQVYNSPPLALNHTYQFYVVAFCGTSRVDSSSIYTFTTCRCTNITYGAFSTSICQGHPYTYNGVDLYTAGAYKDTFINYTGCDSIVTLSLSVIPSSSYTMNQSICAGSTYSFNGLALNTTGVYYDTLVNYLACDSFITLNLNVINSTSGMYTEVICTGVTYTFNGNILNTSGTYLDTLVNYLGCDSFLTLNLVVSLCTVPTLEGRSNMCSPVALTSPILTSIDYGASGYANINTHTDTFYYNNIYSRFETGEPIGSCGGAGTNNKTDWFSFRTPSCATPEVIISTDDRSVADFDTRISVYRRTIPGDCSTGYNEIACSDNDPLPGSTPGATNSTVILTPNISSPGTNEYLPGEYLYTQVSGVGSAIGNYGLIIDVNPYIPITSSVGSGVATIDWSIGMSPTWGDVRRTYIYWRPVASSSTYSGTYRILDSTISNLTITGLTPGTDYEYWAAYVCDGGGRWFSKKGTFTTSATCTGGTSPSIVSITTGTPCTQPVINFDATSLAYSSYRIVRRQIGSSSVLTSSVYYTSPTTQTYVSPPLALGRTYEFYVVAYCGTDKVDSSAISTYTVCSSLRTSNPEAVIAEQSSVDEFIKDGGSLYIYPNPSHTFTTLDYSLNKASEHLTVIILDNQGKELFNKQIINPELNGNIQLDLNKFSSGVYYVKLYTDAYVHTSKLFVDSH